MFLIEVSVVREIQMSKETISTILIGHYPYDQHASMERFDKCISDQLEEKGGDHETWRPPTIFGRIKPSPHGFGKWLGYIDKFILFPIYIRLRILLHQKRYENALFILPDHSHGIYVSLFQNRPHVFHVHDLIAIRMAKNDFYGQSLSWSGKKYQQLIGRGLHRGKHFICISEASKRDLQKYVGPNPESCQVVLNELNYPYHPVPVLKTLDTTDGQSFTTHAQSFLLHVGNQLWYKNRKGVLEIYDHFVRSLPLTNEIPSLCIVGESATAEDLKFIESLPDKAQVFFFSGLSSAELENLYSQAIGLLFPSHYEGFGWPIIEALACGCHVLTTQRAPMTEVGGTVADYVEPVSESEKDLSEFAQVTWTTSAVKIIQNWISESKAERSAFSQEAIAHAAAFKPGTAFLAYYKIYQSIVNSGVLAQAQQGGESA